jgi:hypothetical protein
MLVLNIRTPAIYINWVVLIRLTINKIGIYGSYKAFKDGGSIFIYRKKV